MESVTTSDLRSDLGKVLPRVESGERLLVTVRGRPDAELAPLPSTPHSMRWNDFMANADQWRADPGLLTDLEHILES